jgi:hypothetical protein
MKAWKAFVLCSGLLAGSANASILPPNNLHLQDNMFARSGLSEAKFNQILDEVQAAYDPIFEAQNATLVIDRNWTDSTVNAYAQKWGSQWIIAMFGGLARRAEVTPDGFALVACHEIGHHLAGFPTYGGSDMSVEGQSDYFAAQSCARVLWQDETSTNAKFRQMASSSIKSRCDVIHSSMQDQDLCYRTVMAGESLAKLLAALEGARIDVNTPSREVATSTMAGHPPAQCRLDTYLAASLCTVEFDSYNIPYTWSEARQVSCIPADGFEVSVRPKCWFKSPE